jgi:hypothetical protein
VEADATFRNVFTLDDFVRVRRVAHARGETHADSNVAPFVDGPPVCIKLSLENVLGLRRGRTRCVPGRAIGGSGAGSTAVAVATADEAGISADCESDRDANSEMVDVPEYEDTGAAEAVAGEAPSPGSKDSPNEPAGELRAVLDVRDAGEGGGAVKFVLAGLAVGDGTALRLNSGDAPEGLGGGASATGRTLPSAFFQGVDVAHSAQWRRMYPLTE